MKTKIIEATNGELNWGKFLVQKFDIEEWSCPTRVGSAKSLLNARGWSPDHILVVDLETGEGAIFRHGGMASADLGKHKIWVCPLYQPFLEWLYKQDVSDLSKLPDHVDLKDAEFQFHGYRRPGLTQAQDVRASVPAEGKNDLITSECSTCKAPILKPSSDKRAYMCLECLSKSLDRLGIK